jgi:hypothetical protein
VFQVFQIADLLFEKQFEVDEKHPVKRIKQVQKYTIKPLKPVVASVRLMLAESQQGNIFYDQVATQDICKRVMLDIMADIPDVSINANKISEIPDCTVHQSISRKCIV